MISLAKREEEVFLPGRSEPLRLPRRSPALRLLQQARDEAHRFAVTYNRQRRSARTLTSELLKIPGIGRSKRRALLQAFGSLEGVRDARAGGDRRAPGVLARERRDGCSRPCVPTHVPPAAPTAGSAPDD